METLAIVEATYAEVDARHSAIMLRMWHHAPELAHREILMADFDGGGQPHTFVQAFLAAIRSRQRGSWPNLRAPIGLARAHLPMLEQAFVGALRDVLGRVATAMVVNAWGEMVRAFLRELCRRGCPA